MLQDATHYRRQHQTLVLYMILPYLLNDLFNPLLREMSLALLWGVDVMVMGFEVFMITYIIRLRFVNRRQIGLTEFSIDDIIKGIVSLILLLIIFGIIVNNMLEVFLNTKYAVQPIFPDEFEVKLGLIIYASLTAGVIEEIVYRGIFMRSLQQWTRSPAAGVIISSVVFGIAHWENGLYSVIYTGLLGLVLAIWVQREGRLWAPIIAHTLYDFIVFMLNY